MYRFLDSTSGLRQPLVVDRPAPTFGRSLAQLVERDLIEILGNELQAIGEIVVRAAHYNASATRSIGCLTLTPAAAR